MNYYNEIDPRAAAWIQELINEKLIPDGKIDTRSIVDVQPGDLAGFTQCHFFCGIAGWSRALRLAGWPDDREIWTGSCPCQPFSEAGKGEGLNDERHLWPHLYRLICACRPRVVIGEQVASSLVVGKTERKADSESPVWIDGVRLNLESAHYTFGATDLPAACINAPHIRQRLYWVANAELARREATGCGSEVNPGRELESGQSSCWMGEPIPTGLQGHTGDGDNGSQSGRLGAFEAGSVAKAGKSSWMEDARRDVGELATREWNGPVEANSAGASSEPAGRSASSFWSDSTWRLCRDWKSRRIPAGSESVFFGLSHEFSENLDPVWIAGHGFPLAPKIQGRAAILKGYGNAIVPELAAEFIRAVMQEI